MAETNGLPPPRSAHSNPKCHTLRRTLLSIDGERINVDHFALAPGAALGIIIQTSLHRLFVTDGAVVGHHSASRNAHLPTTAVFMQPPVHIHASICWRWGALEVGSRKHLSDDLPGGTRQSTARISPPGQRHARVQASAA